MIVTFNDGTVVYGFFGKDSLAASDGNRGDIYLERLYHRDGNDRWSEALPRRGTLLSLDGMRSIEFLETEIRLEGTGDAE